MNQISDYMQNRRSRRLARRVRQNLGASSPPYVPLKDNRLHLVDAAGDKRPLPTSDRTSRADRRAESRALCDVVIVDVNGDVSRIFYMPTTIRTRSRKCRPASGATASRHPSRFRFRSRHLRFV